MKTHETPTRIDWQEVRLDEVVRFYSDVFRFADGERPLLIEYFIDQHKGRIVYKIIIEERAT